MSMRQDMIDYILVGSQHTIILAGRDFDGVFQKLMTMVSANNDQNVSHRKYLCRLPILAQDQGYNTPYLTIYKKVENNNNM